MSCCWYQESADAHGITASWNRSGTSADDVFCALPREGQPEQVPQDRLRLGLTPTPMLWAVHFSQRALLVAAPSLRAAVFPGRCSVGSPEPRAGRVVPRAGVLVLSEEGKWERILVPLLRGLEPGG